MDTTQTNDTRNILFVDSDKSLSTDLSDWIEKMEIENKYGLTFAFVDDAKSAMKRLGTTKIDLVVLEIALPIVSGYYLINAIKKEYPTIEIIIYTRLRSPQDLARMASCNVENIFLKELMHTEDLVDIIRNKETSGNIDEIVMELKSQIKTLHAEGAPKEDKLIQCQHCHLIIAPNSHFCNNCGQKIQRKPKKILKRPRKTKNQ